GVTVDRVDIGVRSSDERALATRRLDGDLVPQDPAVIRSFTGPPGIGLPQLRPVSPGGERLAAQDYQHVVPLEARRRGIRPEESDLPPEPPRPGQGMNGGGELLDRS